MKRIGCLVSQFLIVGLVLTGLFWSCHHFLVVRQVQCQNIDSETEISFCDQLQAWQGRSLFLTNFAQDQLLSQAIGSLETTESVFLEKIEKKLPGTLILSFSTQLPVYRLHTPQGEKFLVTTQGELKTDLPDLEITKVQVLGSWTQIDQANEPKLTMPVHQFVQQLVQSLQMKQIEFQQIELVNQEVIKIKLPAKRVALVELAIDPALQIERLSLILNNLTLEEIDTEIKEIDLRFKLPVLRTNFTH